MLISRRFYWLAESGQGRARHCSGPCAIKARGRGGRADGRVQHSISGRATALHMPTRWIHARRAVHRLTILRGRYGSKVLWFYDLGNVTHLYGRHACHISMSTVWEGFHTAGLRRFPEDHTEEHLKSAEVIRLQVSLSVQFPGKGEIQLCRITPRCVRVCVCSTAVMLA